MPKYYELDVICEMFSDILHVSERDIEEILENAPTEDVVPRAEVELDEIAYKSLKELYDNDVKELSDNNERLRAEVEDLEYKLAGVMHFVDKWLEGDELNQDEVNRAITMREKTLKLVEDLDWKADFLEQSYNALEKEVEQSKREVAKEIITEIKEKLKAINREIANGKIYVCNDDSIDKFVEKFEKKYIGE